MKTETYWDFVKLAIRMSFPMWNEWDRFLDYFIRFALVTWNLIAVTVIRLFLLITLPISAPLVGWLLYRAKIRYDVKRETEKRNIIHSMTSLSRKSSSTNTYYED